MQFTKILGHKIPVIGTMGKDGKITFFKEENNMNNLIVINIEVNGKKVPLYKISEQTLLTMRKNSKPKSIPVARVANYPNDLEKRRLLLKVPNNINDYVDCVVAIDLKSGNIVGSQPIDAHEARYANFYDNVEVIE